MRDHFYTPERELVDGAAYRRELIATGRLKPGVGLARYVAPPGVRVLRLDDAGIIAARQRIAEELAERRRWRDERR